MSSYYPVGIWIRVSTQMQVQDESPAHHEFRARAYAQSQGWQVVELYDLAGFSGKDVLNHPETQRMLEDIKTGRIKALIFSKLARLARNTQQLLYFADIFRSHGASLVSLSEAFDTNTPAGMLFYTLIAAMASWEREEIGQRIKDSIIARAKLGKCLGGVAPYGYQRVNNRLELHAEEAPIRKLMIELYLKHRRINTVARILNEMGSRTRQGNLFTHSSVKILLRDTITKGMHRVNYIQDHGDHWEYKPESEWLYVPAPALVDTATWDACLAILDEQALKQKKKGRNPKHLFSGLVVCAHCDKKMYIRHQENTYRCDPCKQGLSHALLEPFFIEQLGTFLSKDDWIQNEKWAAQNRLAQCHQQIAELTEQRQIIKLQQDALHRLFQNNHLSGLDFQERNTPLFEQIQTLTQKIGSLEAGIHLLQSTLQKQAHIVYAAREQVRVWPGLGKAEQRAVLESMVETIQVGKQETSIVIDLAYRSMTSDELHAKRYCNSRASISKTFLSARLIADWESAKPCCRNWLK